MKLTRRSVLFAAAALVAGCEPYGKLVRTVFFDVTENAHASLSHVTRVFAERHAFGTFVTDPDGMYFTLQNSDFSIVFEFQNATPVSPYNPPQYVFPARYRARFYVNRSGANLDDHLVNDFDRALTAVGCVSTGAS